MSNKHRIEVEGATFSIPARPTVMQMLHYRSMAATAGGFLVGGWLGIRPMITDWESDVLPDHMADINEVSSWAATEVITDAVLRVQEYMRSLDQEKN